VLEDGEISYPEEGTPQGGVVTPPTILRAAPFGQRREGFSLGNWAFCESWEMRKEPDSLTVPTEYASVRKESGSWLNDSALDHSGDSDR
jgi:hypothetical protein